MKLKVYALLKTSLLLFFAVAFANLTYAQRTISGTITDAANGDPLISATVVVPGTSTGTITDFDGNFTLDVPDGTTQLEVSYTGYATQLVNLDASNVVDIALSAGTVLDEVVVIGYGVTTVEDATGAVTSVTSDDFNGGVISSPEQLIQGKAAGVQISQASGEPGAGVAVRIRGTGSVRSNNNPLFVVDGVPLGGDDTGGAGANIGFGGGSARNPLNFLNPNDIESISVLKDASATAIYGSRGANGVVIITTKSGKAGRGGTWELASDVSVASPANEFDLLDRDQFLDGIEQFGGDRNGSDFGSNTDWQDFVTRTAVSTNHNLSYSQNYGKGNIRATFGYGLQNGVLEESSMERITGRLNWKHRFLDDRLTLGFQGTISRVNDENPPLSGSAGFQGDILGAAYSANPTWSTSLNLTSDELGSQISPAMFLNSFQSTTETDRYLLNGTAQYEIAEGLIAGATIGYDRANSTRNDGTNRQGLNLGEGVFGNGRGGVTDITRENLLFEATLTWNKDLGNSNLELLGGYSYQEFNSNGRNVIGWGFGTDDLDQMASDLANSAGSIEDVIRGDYQQYFFAENLSDVIINRIVPDIVSGETASLSQALPVRSVAANFFDTTDEIQSFFARANYTVADKYLFTATLRADGSSRFGGNNQYGYFPSAAFAWKIHEEGFFNSGALSSLKLRLGWGITGNQDGLEHGNFIQRQRFAFPGGPSGIIANDGAINNIPGLEPVSFANPDLKWEETTQYTVGFDYGFLDDRLNGTIEFYYKSTEDLLLRTQSAQPAAQAFVFQNVDGEVINQGVEFAINYDILRNDDFFWDVGFNIAYNDNEFRNSNAQLAMGTIRGQGLSQAFAQQLEAGQPLFSFFLREFEGFDSEGQPIQEDIQVFVGESALPDVTGGLSTNLSYKNWDFAAYFNYQFGQAVYNNTANAFFTAGSIGSGRNVTEDVLTSGESGTAAAEVSTRFLEDAGFIRLQTVSIGYQVPVVDEGFFSSVRFSLSAQNLFVITDYTGLDPEVSVSPAAGEDLLNRLPVAGIDYTAFPRPRVFTFGVNLTF